MIDMYVNHSLFYEDNDGNEKVNYTRYELIECNAEDFTDHAHEKQNLFWTDKTHEKHYSCIDDPESTLSVKGTPRIKTKENQYSTFRLIIDRCNGKDQCNDEATIDKWTLSKQAIIRVLNPQ